MMTFRELDNALTAPGQYFEVSEHNAGAYPLRVWKNAPATLRDVFLAGRVFGERTYIQYQGEKLSYAEHTRQVGALANRLSNEFGIRRGDRVALAMRNYPEWPVSFWAVTAIGAVVVPVNAWLTERELRHVIGDCGARVLLADRQRAEAIAPWAGETALEALVVARGDGSPAGAHDFASLVASGAPDELPEAEITADDNATIFYTSGTTGLPKGALGSHRNICSSAFGGGYMVLRALIRRGGKAEDMALMAQHPQTGLLSVPFFHVTGCVGGLINMYSGGGRLLLMHKWNPELAVEMIEQERVNFFVGVPTMAWQIIEHSSASGRDLSSLNSIAFGGAPAAPELCRRLNDTLPAAVPSTGYGITETSATVAAFAGADYARQPDSAGAPLPVCEFRFVDEHGKDVATGELGEIWIRGPGVVKGYWNNPEASASAFRDGWFHTGDIGRTDSEGLVYIVDRLKDMIIRGGENIYCAEVEAALLECPGVRSAAVIGVPHTQLGEEVGAVLQVEVAGAEQEAAIRKAMTGKLASFKQPTHYWLRTGELPVGATGKILKREIRQEVLGG